MGAKRVSAVSVFILLALSPGLAQTPGTVDRPASRDFALISVNRAGAVEFSAVSATSSGSCATSSRSHRRTTS